MSQPVQQLQRVEHELGPAVRQRLAQAVNESLTVQAAQALLAEGGPGAVPNQSFQSLPVPARQADRTVHAPAAAALPGEHLPGCSTVQVAVPDQEAPAAPSDLLLQGEYVGLGQLDRLVKDSFAAGTRRIDAVCDQNMVSSDLSRSR